MKPDPRNFPCSKCGAKAGELCKRLSPGRFQFVDGVHDARKKAAESDRAIEAQGETE